MGCNIFFYRGYIFSTQSKQIPNQFTLCWLVSQASKSELNSCKCCKVVVKFVNINCKYRYLFVNCKYLQSCQNQNLFTSCKGGNLQFTKWL